MPHSMADLPSGIDSCLSFLLCGKRQGKGHCLQAKLLEGLAGQREANRQLQQARQAFDAERAQLELYIQRAKQEGAVRIQTLEETVRKLGNRSDLHQVRLCFADLVSTCKTTSSHCVRNATDVHSSQLLLSVHACRLQGT